MKVGVRKPGINKSISASTKGRVNRMAKKAVNPLYGQKGMGFANDPKRAVYNKVYNKTTVDALKPLKTSGAQAGANMKTTNNTKSVPVNIGQTTTVGQIGNIEVKVTPFTIDPVSMVKKPGKGKLVWGIILAAIGFFGLIGSGSITASKGLYIILCLILLLVGALLIFLFVKAKKKYNQKIAEINEQKSREQKLEQTRQEVEQAKLDAELRSLRADAKGAKVCQVCGASTKGSVCEYCGSKL